MKLLSSTLILSASHQGFKSAALTEYEFYGWQVPSATHVLTNSFTLFGNGYCTDSSQNFYSYVEGKNVGPAAEDCSAWCLQNPNKLLGFSYSSSDDERCYCEFDGGEIPVIQFGYIYVLSSSESSGYSGTVPISGTSSRYSGTGPISGTSPSKEDYGCYAYQLSSPTSAPTETPTLPPTTNSCHKSARKVRLESTTGQQLQMFELRAFSSATNVALNKQATQSSTLQNNAASRAIDGESLTFSHTNDLNPHFEVDLGDTFDLESVEIVNRWCQDEMDPNGCLCRLSYANLKLLDGNNSIVATRTLGNTCNDSIIYESFATAC